MRRTQIAGLDVVLTGGEDREGGGKGTPAVVLLHGFGAPGTDLVPLWRVLDVPRETRFVFPAAPLETHMMPGADSRAWWNIDMVRLQSAMERGELRDLSAEEPEGLAEARQTMDAFLRALAEELAPNKLVLGGFSQGAMLSVDVALRTEHRPAALVILSGTLLAEKIWVSRMKALAGLPVFQSHGADDPLLPYALAERLKEELTAAGARVTFEAFRGGHEIPPSVLDGVGTFLRSVLSDGP
jgi:phospholipase/carboxylesterase